MIRGKELEKRTGLGRSIISRATGWRFTQNEQTTTQNIDQWCSDHSVSCPKGLTGHVGIGLWWRASVQLVRPGDDVVLGAWWQALQEVHACDCIASRITGWFSEAILGILPQVVRLLPTINIRGASANRDCVWWLIHKQHWIWRAGSKDCKT